MTETDTLNVPPGLDSGSIAEIVRARREINDSIRDDAGFRIVTSVLVLVDCLRREAGETN